MIKGKMGADVSIGAGIIFSRTHNSLQIMTANHVVRRSTHTLSDIQVKLKDYPSKWFPGTLLEYHDVAKDVAVLEVNNLESHGIEIYISNSTLNILRQNRQPARGDPVFPIGHPNGVPWGIPAVPDRVAQVVGDTITFQSSFIASGHSGGGLFDEEGALVGMIIRDQPPFGLAVQIEAIAQQLEAWQLPLGLQHIDVSRYDGRWKPADSRAIKEIVLKTDGDRLTGTIIVMNPECPTACQIDIPIKGHIMARTKIELSGVDRYRRKTATIHLEGERLGPNDIRLTYQMHFSGYHTQLGFRDRDQPEPQMYYGSLEASRHEKE
jgi:hypothetical protein